MLKLYHDLTLPEAISMAETSLVLPITRIFSDCVWETIEIKENEYLLPPVYYECMPVDKIEAFSEAIRSQIPFYKNSRNTNIRLQHLMDNESDKNIGETIIFNVDPVEQHGPHLNLATDYNLSYAFITSLKDVFPHISRVPPLYFGCMRWGLSLGASVSVSQEMLTMMINEYLSKMVKSGARRAIIVSTHLAPNHIDVLTNIQKSRNDISIAIEMPLRYLEETNYDCHAGLVETALSVYLGLPVKRSALNVDYLSINIISKKYIESISHLDLDALSDHIKDLQWNGIVGSFDELKNQDLYAELKNSGQRYFDDIIRKLSLSLEGFIKQ